MKVNIVNRSHHNLPSNETEASACLDLRANLEIPVVLKPLERTLIPAGLFIEPPAGLEARIRSGSHLP